MERRRTILTVLLVALVPGLLLTRALVNSYRHSRQALATEWAARGDQDLTTAPKAAVDDFRTALSYGGDDPSYRLKLAQALLASDRTPEAEAHLLTLWTEQPGSGLINLQLARISAHRGDLRSATRYYHGAIDGAWPENAVLARRGARFELARALIASGDNEHALAELIALAGGINDNASQLVDVGELMVKAGAESRALTTFRAALTLAPADARASRLAGQTAYVLGDYDAARRFLARSAALTPLPDPAKTELAVSTRVVALDPFARGISLRDRARRTIELFQVARERLSRCAAGAPPGTPMETLTATVERIAPSLTRPRLARDDDLLDEALDTAFAIEQLQASTCGDPSVNDRAIALLARERTGGSR